MIKKLLPIFLLTSSFILAQQSYYNDVDLNLTGISLKNELATKIINTHTNPLTYTPGVWESSKATDVNPNNSTEVLLIYGYTASGVTARTRGINQNGGGQSDWNREHVFARSLANPDLDAVSNDGAPNADAHNLRPADPTQNSTRSNRKFGKGSGTASGDSTDNNGDGRKAWYPGDEWKGDVARMMMYMYLRYGDQCKPTFVGIGDATATPDDMIDLFLDWNAEDPVSDVEKQRNDFHGNTANTYAQGNRNPFIDNPRLATRIWGGPLAEDLWGIYTSNDTEAPTVPMNLSSSNITTFSIDLTWDAATDNTAVTSYNVYLDGTLHQNITSTSTTISGLNSNTQYSLTVSAKDAADNESAQSTALVVSTIQDTEAPTVPTNVTVSNETDVSFKVSWTASTDNTAVTSYDVYLNGSLNNSSNTTEYTVTGLTLSTTYSVQVLAKDAAGNQSALSTAVNGTTTDGSTSGASELFFSEYVEGSSNNKALEIANITGSAIDLSGYSIKRNGNGGAAWSAPLNLSGTIASGDVYVIINGSAALQTLIDEADYVHPNNSSTNNGEPINFNGNDPVGLFKNDVLIDIIGVFNSGSANFAKDVTLRRKSTVVGPNTTYNFNTEWDDFAQNTVDDIGKHTTSTASVNDEVLNSIQIFPNPMDKFITITNTSNFNIEKVSLFSIIGKKVFETSTINNNRIELGNLNKGIYLIKIKTDLGITTRKIVKK